MVRVLAISAANIRHQPEGTSVRLARLALQQLQQLLPGTDTDLVTLVDKVIEPCIGCGGCARGHRCVAFSDDFAAIYDLLLQADALIIVSAHYAPIPAKLCAFFERVESISFLGWHDDAEYRRPLCGKPYAVVGHCGGPPAIWDSYYDVIFAPIKNALGFPVSMQPIETGEGPRIGCMLGPSEVKHDPDSVFPQQVYDQTLIEERVSRVTRALADMLRQSVSAPNP